MNLNIIKQIHKQKFVLNDNDLDMYDDYDDNNFTSNDYNLNLLDESIDESIDSSNPINILLKENDTELLLDNNKELPLDNKNILNINNILDFESVYDLDKDCESLSDLESVSEEDLTEDLTDDIDNIIDTIYNYNENFKNNPYYKEYLLQNFDCLLNNQNSNKEVYIEPTQLRISTMTAICCINLCVDLELLYNTFNSLDNNIEQFPYIKSCKLGNHKMKGDSIKKKKKCFQNQATLIISLNPTRKINMKIFRNGKIQMTGLKSEQEGIYASETLLKYIHNNIEKNKKGYITDMSIVLINSDFGCGFKIKREQLYNILTSKNIYTTYEPDIYPGVNAKYYWNNSNKKKDGICYCNTVCNGKGHGNGDGDCKKITIATFQSGNVIITGARKKIQTQDAYTFINNIFSSNYDNLVRSTNNNLLDKPNKTKFKIKIENILNYELYKSLISN